MSDAGLDAPTNLLSEYLLAEVSKPLNLVYTRMLRDHAVTHHQVGRQLAPIRPIPGPGTLPLPVCAVDFGCEACVGARLYPTTGDWFYSSSARSSGACGGEKR